MPRKESRVKKNATVQEKPATINIQPGAPSPKRGRKLKYQTDEERREARREQNRRYRERKKEELIALRRSAAKREKEESINTETDKNNESNDEQVDAIPIDL